MDNIILSIESSCDDTAVAVTRGREILSSVIASQVDEHTLYGGVVPEIASRRHIENIGALYEKALSDANMKIDDIDAVAVTYAPGLIGSLLTGVGFAKGIAFAQNIPLIPVHHLRSHIAANYIDTDLKPPFLCLVISGGHSHIVYVKDYTDYEIIARTRDDAAGECFDKTARAMGLPYPGGVHMDKVASGDGLCYKLPKPKIEKNDLDFSFSGLKTAVLNTIHNANQKGEQIDVPKMCACVRKTVCDVLLEHTDLALEKTGCTTLALAGGVSANSEIRRRFQEYCKDKGLEFYCPQLKFCGDNAAMVGVQGYYEYMAGVRADLDLNARATLDIETLK